MPFFSDTGAIGADGANGVAPGQDGGAGSAGEALAHSFDSSVDPDSLAVITLSASRGGTGLIDGLVYVGTDNVVRYVQAFAGDGQNGGNGGAAEAGTGLAGAGGDGGDGGAGAARVIDTVTNASALATSGAFTLLATAR